MESFLTLDERRRQDDMVLCRCQKLGQDTQGGPHADSRSKFCPERLRYRHDDFSLHLKSSRGHLPSSPCDEVEETSPDLSEDKIGTAE